MRGLLGGIAHEKGHIEGEILDYQKSKEFFNSKSGVKDYLSGHLKGDPGGDRAFQEEKRYMDSKKEIIRSKGFYKY